MAELIKINFEENSIKSDASLTMDRLDILSFDVALNDEKTIKASESDDNGTTKTTSHETSASTNGDARTSLDVTTLASHDVDKFFNVKKISEITTTFCGGGQVVIVLTLHSNDLSSNPAKIQFEISHTIRPLLTFTVI